MIRALLPALVVAISAMATAVCGCAGAAPRVAFAGAPQVVRVDPSLQDFLLPERDGMVQMQMSGKVFATELPEDRGGEGFRLIDSACGIVPEDRDRR